MQWAIPAVLEIRCTVFVEADSAAEAIVKFNAGDWIEDDRDVGECCDWKKVCGPEKNE